MNQLDNQTDESTFSTRVKIIFLTSLDGEAYNNALRCLGGNNCITVRDLASLKARADDGNILVSFGTSVIVPENILEKFENAAYNIHAASPEYPGRDPHHWAIYDRVVRYGATAHIMTKKVDDGPIVDVEYFDVAKNTRPETLLQRSNEAALKILSRIGPMLLKGETLKPQCSIVWGKKKRTRADFLAKCKIASSISREDFESIYWAFDGSIHNNLTIELHGKIFRIEK